jgi:hypothetical protein
MHPTEPLNHGGPSTDHLNVREITSQLQHLPISRVGQGSRSTANLHCAVRARYEVDHKPPWGRIGVEPFELTFVYFAGVAQWPDTMHQTIHRLPPDHGLIAKTPVIMPRTAKEVYLT